MSATPMISFGIIGLALVGLLVIVGTIVIVAVVAANSNRRDR